MAQSLVNLHPMLPVVLHHYALHGALHHDSSYWPVQEKGLEPNMDCFLSAIAACLKSEQPGYAKRQVTAADSFYVMPSRAGQVFGAGGDRKHYLGPSHGLISLGGSSCRDCKLRSSAGRAVAAGPHNVESFTDYDTIKREWRHSLCHSPCDPRNPRLLIQDDIWCWPSCCRLFEMRKAVRPECNGRQHTAFGKLSIFGIREFAK